MKKHLLLSLLIITISYPILAQKKQVTPSGSDDPFTFKSVVELKATPVKNQARTNTCWCFATTSFIESELLRMGKGEYDLSEMFIIRYNYTDRLKDNYLRQGKGNTDEGGQSHDWMKIFTEKGIVPDEVYSGLNYGSPTHNHAELNRMLKAVAEVAVNRKNQSDQYLMVVESILDTYLGEIPKSFTWKGETYTPQTFAKSLGINPDDYVEITSLTHFPFYTQGVLEVPDNWRMNRFHNVPVDELIQIMDYALNNGFTVNWDGDTSEDGFTNRKGVALLPSSNVTQEMRQTMFENFTTTDDHLMHITGIAKDQNGAKYYITKNSWGPESNKYGGYLNISEQYVRAKTLFIMVNKNSIPALIKSKLGI
ncbi:MAG TPA: C1 family peptidase [Bacteroidales bacterium]|nr:C1 family peptidase [Bacteroidales bacterium]